MNKYKFLEAINEAGLNQRTLALKTEKSYRVVNNHINGITKIGLDDIKDYSLALGIQNDPVKIYQIFLN